MGVFLEEIVLEKSGTIFLWDQVHNLQPVSYIVLTREKGGKSKWEKKQVIPVLLVNPVCAEFVFQPNQGAETVIEPGSSVNGKEITSLPYFLYRIKVKYPSDVK